MKIKINVVDGKATCPGISLGDGRVLVPENDTSNQEFAKNAGVTLETVADVEEGSMWDALLDRGIIVKVAGRPRAA